MTGSKNVINLHGKGEDCVCMSCGVKSKREDYHELLKERNPKFFEKLSSAEKTNEIRPDGDADINVDYDELELVECPSCSTGIIKPDVVFFGANVDRKIVDSCYELCDSSENLIVAGSSLMVYSGFRFVKEFIRLEKNVTVVNVGETRGDGVEGVDKIEGDVGQIFGRALEVILEKGRN